MAKFLLDFAGNLTGGVGSLATNMSTPALEQLIDRWTNEPAFRDALRRDPEGTVRNEGVQLSDDEMAALRSTDWSLSDEALQSRMSKVA
jgi:hypothetical protein